MSSFHLRRFIHWVDMAENVWLLVGQLPIKAGWWDAPLAIREFIRRNMHDHSTKIYCSTDLFLLFARDHSTKIYVPFSFIFSFVHGRSTKTYGTHWYISFICTRPFVKNIWASFIYSFFSARPFDQKLGSKLIYFLYLYTTIRPKIRVLINLFFL